MFLKLGSLFLKNSEFPQSVYIYGQHLTVYLGVRVLKVPQYLNYNGDWQCLKSNLYVTASHSTHTKVRTLQFESSTLMSHYSTQTIKQFRLVAFEN